MIINNSSMITTKNTIKSGNITYYINQQCIIPTIGFSVSQNKEIARKLEIKSDYYNNLYDFAHYIVVNHKDNLSKMTIGGCRFDVEPRYFKDRNYKKLDKSAIFNDMYKLSYFVPTFTMYPNFMMVLCVEIRDYWHMVSNIYNTFANIENVSVAMSSSQIMRKRYMKYMRDYLPVRLLSKSKEIFAAEKLQNDMEYIKKIVSNTFINTLSAKYVINNLFSILEIDDEVNLQEYI